MRSLRMMSALGLLAALFSADGAAAAPSQVTYTIRPGDTLGAIGARCGVGYQQIAAANGITNPNVIEVGKQLNIPGSKGCSNAAVAAPVARAAAPSAAGSAAVPAAPVAAGAPAGFGYGVQVHAPDGDQGVIDRVKGMRFNWVKQQVEWFRYEGAKGERNFSGLENLVNQANANGVNVMFSVVKAPD